MYTHVLIHSVDTSYPLAFTFLNNPYYQLTFIYLFTFMVCLPLVEVTLHEARVSKFFAIGVVSLVP